MTSLTDNPALLDPRKTLTASQKDALCTIAYFKGQRTLGRNVHVGKKRFQPSTIDALVRMGLLRGRVPALSPTVAGQLAISKLRGDIQ